MDDLTGAIAPLWREACFAGDLATFTDRAAAHVSSTMPVRALLVQQPSAEAETLTTVAAGPLPSASRWLGAGRELEPGAAGALRAWLAGDGPAPAAADLAPAGLEGPLCAGRLAGRAGARAVLLVALAAEEARDGRAGALAAALAEPFGAALDADARLAELQARQRSAEEERESLLVRLGRDQLLETIVGEDGGLRAVMQRVAVVAASDVPVLILGETGAGKEVIARAVHARSRRARGPFTRVNCGAIPPELVDSELFGHEKGSFTGATTRRRGWFERADRGTLLLDEIGELPRAAQVRLLRVLQDGLITRVGGEVPVPVDVRVIAATHADLTDMVRRGAFREDLWYRLAVFPLLLPPLRERAQDIPAMVEMLVQRASRHFGLRPRPATADDLALLAAYPWPGNVRELGTVIDRAVLLGGGRRLEVATALGLTPPGTTREPAPSGPAAPPEPLLPLDEAMARHIRAALVAARGRVEGAGGAAALLRVNPHTLRARMRKLGIDWAAYR